VNNLLDDNHRYRGRRDGRRRQLPPAPPWAQWGGGWPDLIEAALIDAVLSIRNRYGKNPTTTSGVRGVVQRYRDDRSGEIRRRPLPRSSHSCGWASPSSSSDHPGPTFS